MYVWPPIGNIYIYIYECLVYYIDYVDPSLKLKESFADFQIIFFKNVFFMKKYEYIIQFPHSYHSSSYSRKNVCKIQESQ